MRNASLKGGQKIGSSHSELSKSRTGKQWERDGCRQQMATMSSRRSSRRRRNAATRVTAALPLHVASQNKITPLFKGLTSASYTTKLRMKHTYTNEKNNITNFRHFFGRIPNHLNALNTP